ESLWTPTAREMETAEALLPQYFSDKIARLKFQDSCHERGYFHIQPLNQFFRQYAGLVMDGQRFLYLNFFNKSYAGGNLGASREWRFEPVMICDGGPDFWGLEFDLEKQRFQNPRFNGWLSECP
ncbi:MAG: hypothetical protein GWM98_07570, partial [Nitrospinaceae bacterium]|nr:hypothetical protein [Nitrospinaceae bacterium]NIR54384.1 hypothetical protein [Nitrospinaceae bacterium]NIS84797.1 hypothetical protein [Nitrospinaceae bacterium]NIT81603.1 hypothetical protein [Nitrospinaceae bacterium]NIU43885.1 hypothetical protein [Nitrospinaceae bacterium]